MTAPDRIQITHAQPMIMPHTALTSDDIPPGPFSEDDLRRGWNQQADEHNQWESLDSAEQLAWAQALAIKADRHAALKAESEGEGPSLAGVDELCAEFGFHCDDDQGETLEMLRDMISASLARWGHPHAAAPALVPTYLDAIRLAQGCHDYSGGHSGAESEAWHGAIDTVVNVLKRAAIRPWDSQTMAVFGVGAEAQAGEMEA